MNQILYEDKGDKKPANIKSIILFFGIAVIVFGFILGSIGAVQLINSKTGVSKNKPSIFVEKFDDNQIKLNIKHDKTIEKIEYDWNGTNQVVIEGANRKFIERLIEIPDTGENVLYVHVLDSLGIEENYIGTYSRSNNGKGPKIILSQVEEEGTKKIGILAEDDDGLAYITYRWNDNEETMITGTEDNSKVIQTNIDIPTDLPGGRNELIVVAVNESNNQSKEIQEIKIARKPVIAMPKQNKSKLTIKVTDDVGLDYVQYILNGVSYTWKSSGEVLKTCETAITLKPGENSIVIKAGNKDGIEANPFYGICIYEAD